MTETMNVIHNGPYLEDSYLIGLLCEGIKLNSMAPGYIGPIFIHNSDSHGYKVSTLCIKVAKSDGKFRKLSVTFETGTKVRLVKSEEGEYIIVPK